MEDADGTFATLATLILEVQVIIFDRIFVWLALLHFEDPELGFTDM